jgi:hypothetical protein
MGLFARTPFKGQKRILDCTGQVIVTDKRADFKES